jgi:hypothetical protein
VSRRQQVHRSPLRGVDLLGRSDEAFSGNPHLIPVQIKLEILTAEADERPQRPFETLLTGRPIKVTDSPQTFRAQRMKTAMDDRANLEAKWKENEDELNRIARMTGLDQQLFGKREEDLLAEQAANEFELGFTDSAI